MSEFKANSKHLIKYYMIALGLLVVLYFIWTSPFILGLILGTIASTINTLIFEYYLARAKNPLTIHISTGNIWRYLVAFITCVLWYLFKEHINMLGVVLGLMVSYVIIICRSLLIKE